MTCLNCGADNSPGVRFCTKCGSKLLQLRENFCAHCGSKLAENDLFCGTCGAQVRQEPQDKVSAVPMEKSSTDLQPGDSVSEAVAYTSASKIKADGNEQEALENNPSWGMEEIQETQISLVKEQGNESDLESNDNLEEEISGGYNDSYSSYAFSHPEATSGSSSTALYSRYKTHEDLNLLGIFGAVIILIGEFLPFASVSLFFSPLTVNFYQALDETYGSLASVCAVLVPIVMLALYVLRNRKATILLSWAACGYYAYEIITILDESGGEMFFEMIEAGFWVILLGLILSVVSPLLEDVNHRLLSSISRLH